MEYTSLERLALGIQVKEFPVAPPILFLERGYAYDIGQVVLTY